MLNNNLVDKEQFESQLHDRWAWISEDIYDDDVRLNTELVLESSYKYMISEGLIERGWLEANVLNEDADMLTEAPQTTGSVGNYVIPKVMFPIIRRVMEGLIANKLVSVQPIQQPTGVMYYITYDYSNTKGDIKEKEEFSMNPQQTTPGFATWYSSEKVGPLTGTVSGASAHGDGVKLTKGAETVNAFLTNKKDYVLKRVEVYNKTTGKMLDLKPVDSTWFGTTGAAIAEGKVEYNYEDGSVAFKITKEMKEDFTAGGQDEIEAFVVYDQEGSSLIPEMEFHIDHKNVDVKERKLKVRWTKEAEQDMMAYHKINVEQELVKVASVQTNYEIDREIMTFIDDHVISDLSTTHKWLDDGIGMNNTQGNYLDRHRCLAQKLYAAGTKVATFNHLGPCDWAVCSPKMAAVLQMLPDWKAGEIANNKSTFYNAGTLGNGSMAIYVDPNRCGTQEDEITMGYKSKDSTYGAGVVYSPYANWMSGTVVNPDNFNNVRGFFSRYGLTMAPRGQYNYARVRVDFDNPTPPKAPEKKE